jgi:DNA-binding Lrp family transcriptional regulator
MVLNKLDLKILKLGYTKGIQREEKAFFERLNLNRSTTDYILEKLKKEKFFHTKRYEINLPCLGIKKFAWVFISVDWYSFSEENFLEKALNFPEITSVLKITGDFDYALYLIGKNITHINEFILNFERIFQEDIKEIHIYFSNKEYKRHFIKTLIRKEWTPNKTDCILLDEKINFPKTTLTKIAKKYKIHKNTLSNRWKKIWTTHLFLKEHLELTEEGYKAINMGLKLFIILKPLPGKEEKLLNNLINLDEIENIFSTLSNEIIINLRVPDSQSLDLFHTKIMKGEERLIKHSKSILVMGGRKKSHLTISNLLSINSNICKKYSNKN